ncbi:zinc dependent phospholipase C family protein [Sedimentibacter sp. zth1]|uniref:phosphotransferase n=1 Tax=Sedimentibacter sp. zth1 TaxID=2816908 RepID=UPI001A92F0D4|nr:phosphotransferase [Sedimentibacter sp. zth1]QSX06584.1 zinc dependent phospholipase C family protein [Sedimentibacter sp. zth1]
MASFIVHLRVAEKLYNEIENIIEKDFIIGNIAADSGETNLDFSNITPSKEVTHFYTKKSGNVPDPEEFYKEYLENKELDKERYSFYLGYYCHLITDLLWDEMCKSLVDDYGNEIIKPILYSKRGKNSVWENLDLQFLNLEEDFRPYQIFKQCKMYINNYIDVFDKYSFFKKFVQVIDFYDSNGKYLDFNCPDMLKIKLDSFVDMTTNRIIGRLDHFWADIPNSSQWRNIDLTFKNWAGDRKYNIETFNGKKYLLEMSNKSFYKDKQDEFNYAKALASLFVNKPQMFGRCNNNTLTYSIYDRFSTTYLSEILHKLNEKEQYKLGVESGKILFKIHDLNKLNKKDKDWEYTYNIKINHIINMFIECELPIDNSDKIINYINNHRNFLENRPQCLLHGNFQVENIAINVECKTLGVTSLNEYTYGDPWLDFANIVKSVSESPVFACGQINGYFQNKVPDEFFKLLALYIACQQLSDITWSLAYGDERHEQVVNFSYKVFYWYNYFTTSKPNWYKESN